MKAGGLAACSRWQREARAPPPEHCPKGGEPRRGSSHVGYTFHGMDSSPAPPPGCDRFVNGSRVSLVPRSTSGYQLAIPSGWTPACPVREDKGRRARGKTSAHAGESPTPEPERSGDGPTF